jgi:hypothetical protein
MSDNYIWILLTGFFIFLFIVFALLCFTPTNRDWLFYYCNKDSFFEHDFVECPALLASLSEDARISYEQAKGIIAVDKSGYK